MIEVNCNDRWQAYRRLTELEIDCRCCSYRPLYARIDSPNQAIQLWSIVQGLSQEQRLLRQRLERCWQLKA